MDKKAELELKKAKLEQMRKRKAAANESATSVLSTSTNNENIDAEQVEEIIRNIGLTNIQKTSTTNDETLSTSLQHEPALGQPTHTLVKTRKPCKLEVNVVSTIDIPPKENVTYSKETQTPIHEYLDKEAKQLDYYGNKKEGYFSMFKF
jgi:dynein intermediate chain